MRCSNRVPFMIRMRPAALGAVLAAGLFGSTALAENTTAPDASQVGSVWWSELVSSDPARSRDFYASVFGWAPKVVSAEDTSRAPDPGEAEYTIFMRDGVEVAGAAAAENKRPDDIKPGWVTYIQVANVDQAVVEALKKGGKILKAPFDDGNSGRFAIIQDPDGIAVGLVAPLAATPAH
ncbi:VOC family protein [Hyphomicrobium sp.]|uniref:VOC family protein n=1 Tax=Hyphomicrobium sp. TaxID=82 RepID=UPI002E336A30|nr:VOC family protein [Hyphomicrobium sp.]HEX2842312.1 VOC family protein [Hyphomicrobium sp.]